MDMTACPACGATLEVGARYCRKCGRASSLEADTREFDQNRQSAWETRLISPTTAPELINIPGHPQPAPSMAPPHPSSQRTIIILSSLVGVLVLTLVGVILAFFLVREPGGPPGPPPPPGFGIRPPGAPTAPEPPPPPSPPGTISPALENFVYPGAKVLLQGIDDNRYVYRLRSDDPPAKVRDWYRERLQGGQVVSQPDGVTILTAGEVNVVLTADNSGTMIMITRGR